MKFQNRSSLAATATLSLTTGMLMLTACGEQVAVARAVAVNQASRALNAGELLSANGVYSGCRGRGNGDPWSVEIASGALLANAPLSVVLNDAGCSLSLTSLDTSVDGTLPASTPLGLALAMNTNASSFDTPISFYANAALSVVNDFASDFTIIIPFSDDPTLDTGSNTAGLAIVESSATAQAVLAPDWTLDVDGIDIITDASNEILSVEGDALLDFNSVSGQSYVVFGTGGLSTYANIHSAFNLGVPAPIETTLDSAVFGLSGTLAQTRTLIIRNLDDGVASYQVFTITFNAAP